MRRNTDCSPWVEHNISAKLAFVAAVFPLLLVGCADVKTGLTQAAQNIDSFLGVEREYDTESITSDVEAIYNEGLAFKSDARHDKAARQFYRAASLDHAGAAYELGLAYDEGRGVTKNVATGTRWFRTAADGGDVRAQFVVGARLYAEGNSEEDYSQALGYLTAAADQGHSRAQFVLGEAYANGRGVAMDAAWSARWYGKAAAQGHVRAQFEIGVFRSAGLGVPEDGIAAYAWLSLAAANGHTEAADVRSTLVPNLTAAAIKQADERVSDFKPGPAAEYADEPTVVYVQQTLSALGYDAGKADGVMGAHTRAAIKKYRSKAGLTEDGEITPALVDRLFADSHPQA